MANPDLRARLRVPLSEEHWAQLRQRAALRQLTAASYVDALVRYALYEQLPTGRSNGSADDVDLVYSDLEVPALLKERLSEVSARARLSVASYAGLLVRTFLVKYAKDPRDLGMIHYLTTRLDHAHVLSEHDLRRAVEQCERNAELRLPPGFLAKWIFTRVRPLLPAIERSGTRVQLSVAVVEQIMPELSARPS